MKKLAALLLSALLVMGLAACQTDGGSSAPEAGGQVTVRMAGINGPSAIGMVKLRDDAENGLTENDYTFLFASAPDEVVGKVIQGELDIAAVPTNVAATLYNRTEGDVQLVALTTLGVLYIVEDGETLQSFEDLRGKTIYSTNKGSTPEFALNYLLEQNGLVVNEDVLVEYRSENAEVAALLAQGQAEIAMLPQPFATSVLTQNENIRVALDLTAEWANVTGGESQLAMGSIVINKQFAEENPEVVAQFLREYEASANFAMDGDNLAEVAQLCGKYEVMAAAIAEKAIPECNIVFMTGADMKLATEGFLQVLFEANPESIGGAMPGDDYYFGA